MKNVVIDTSLAIKWFFPEPGFKKALEIKEKHIKGEIVIITRDLFLYEFTSAFKNYSLKKIGEKDFSIAVSAVISLGIKFFPLKHEELEELFFLSRKLNISIYDCSFLLLAKKLRAPFFTADKKLYLKGKIFTKANLV